MAKKKKATKKEMTETIENQEVSQEEKDKQSEEALKANTITMANEDRLELMVANLQMDNLKKTIEARHSKSEFLERERLLIANEIRDLKIALERHIATRESLMVSIGQKLSVNLKKCGVDPATGIVTKHY